jgi:NAD(P)-dependent dehydrogenase (short-subunit alcohol dehydrogenase family)
MTPTYERALIIGAGDGLSASVAHAFHGAGLKIALAARNTAKLKDLAALTKAQVFTCDALEPSSIDALFDDVEKAWGAAPDVLVYNPSGRVRGPLTSLNRDDVQKAIALTAFGGFVAAQAAVRRMEAKGHGAVLFTGASASIKGYSGSAPFAMGKFALRGLAQSMARELAPKGIHIAHFVIDGGIGKAGGQSGEAMLDPDAIARTYLHILQQDRSAWTWEVELRPSAEKF